MGIILWIILGALTGWSASFVLKSGPDEGPFLNVGVGVMGAVVGGYVLTHYLERSLIFTVSTYGIVGAIFAAGMLISLVRSLR